MFLLKRLRLREQRRQPLKKFTQKAPQPPALKPPSTARTAGRSDWAERRFRRQPFILLSFSSSEKLRKAQKMQSYQRFQHIGRMAFNTSGINAATFVSRDCGGYTLAFANRIAHSGSRAQTGRVSDGGGIRTLNVRCVDRNLCARSGQKSILCHLCMDRGNLGEKQRAFGTETRTVRVSVPKAPRPRRVALLRCWLLATPVSFAVCHRCDEVQRENC